MWIGGFQKSLSGRDEMVLEKSDKQEVNDQ